MTYRTRGSSADREIVCAGAIGWDGPRIDETTDVAALGTAGGEAAERHAKGEQVDLDAIAKEYGADRDKLGMDFVFSVPKMASFLCGDVRLMLSMPETPEFDHPASVIYYRVDEINSAVAELKARGVQFEAEPNVVHETDRSRLWMAFLRDPDGNVLAVMSEEAKA